MFSRGDRLVLRLREGGERDLAAADAAAGETAVGWPRAASPDTVLFVSRRKGSNGAVESRLEAVPLRGGGRRRVLDAVDQPLFASANRLVFERGGVLFAVGMSASLETSGEPMRLGQDRVR